MFNFKFFLITVYFFSLSFEAMACGPESCLYVSWTCFKSSITQCCSGASVTPETRQEEKKEEDVIAITAANSQVGNNEITNNVNKNNNNIDNSTTNINTNILCCAGQKREETLEKFMKNNKKN